MLKSALVQNVYAAIGTGENIPGALGGIKDLGTLFTWVTNLVIAIGLGLVIVFLAMGFIRFITSQGDKVATDQAQKWVTYAVLGGVGLFLVYVIKAVILSIVGADDPLKK